MTKKYKFCSILFLALSIFSLSFPMTYYGVWALIEGNKVEKFTLGAFCCVAIGMVAINFIMKWHLRSMIWLVILGIFICLNNIQPLLIMVAVCTILDEICFTPLHKYFKRKYQTNKEIDKRLGQIETQ